MRWLVKLDRHEFKKTTTSGRVFFHRAVTLVMCNYGSRLQVSGFSVLDTSHCSFDESIFVVGGEIGAATKRTGLVNVCC